MLHLLAEEPGDDNGSSNVPGLESLKKPADDVDPEDMTPDEREKHLEEVKKYEEQKQKLKDKWRQQKLKK